MKKNVLILFLLVIIARVIMLLFVKTDVLFFLSPRNFNGRGLLAVPVLSDFLITVLIIGFLFSKKHLKTFSGVISLKHR